MNSNQFVEKLKEVVSMNTIYMWGCFGQEVTESIIATKTKQYPSWYTKARQTKFRKLIGKNYYGFDCVCLIKGILWGFPNMKYESNGVQDIGADAMINACNNTSADFNNIIPGEAVWLSGHIGVYIGNGQVIECTPAWKDGVQITNVSQRKWIKHGKLPYIEYAEESNPVETNAPKIKTVTTPKGLILRSEPTTKSKYITAYPKGTKVTVTAENVANANGHNWDAVIVNGKKGYMANTYLS